MLPQPTACAVVPAINNDRPVTTSREAPLTEWHGNRDLGVVVLAVLVVELPHRVIHRDWAMKEAQAAETTIRAA